MSVQGQNAKYSARVDHFRFSSELGHCRTRFPLRICAKNGLMHPGGMMALPSDGLHFPCRVVWRKERRIGVVFEKLQRPMHPPIPMLSVSCSPRAGYSPGGVFVEHRQFPIL
jgi:hypothetical protein